MTHRITLHILRTTFALLLMQYLLQWQLTNPCLLPDVTIEADRRDSELEGTSCASMKMSAAVTSLRAYSRSSRRSQQIKPRRVDINDNC